MITREQAEQAFREYAERSSILLAYEIRTIQVKQINANAIGSSPLPIPDNDLEGIDLEEVAWLCTYERRYKSQQAWWIKANCYIVEAKPGPYVIE